MGSLSPVDTFNNVKRPVEGITKTPVGGVGDDAVYVTTGRVASLYVMKGDIGFPARVSGVPPGAGQDDRDDARAAGRREAVAAPAGALRRSGESKTTSVRAWYGARRSGGIPSWPSRVGSAGMHLPRGTGIARGLRHP